MTSLTLRGTLDICFPSRKRATEVALSNGLISLGTMQTCARFCVMDDESNEEKMVQLYRDFSEDRTDGNGNSFPPSVGQTVHR